VCLVAKRSIFRFFTATKLVCPIGFNREFLGYHSRPLMAGLITKRLVRAVPTATIKVGLVGFQFDDIGLFLRHIGFVHVCHILSSIITWII